MLPLMILGRFTVLIILAYKHVCTCTHVLESNGLCIHNYAIQLANWKYTENLFTQPVLIHTCTPKNLKVEWSEETVGIRFFDNLLEYRKPDNNLLSGFRWIHAAKDWFGKLKWVISHHATLLCWEMFLVMFLGRLYSNIILNAFVYIHDCMHMDMCLRTMACVCITVKFS